MDDRNTSTERNKYTPKCVQIPLWTIGTNKEVIKWFSIESSDSSMDDRNLLGFRFLFELVWFRFLYGR